MLTRQNGPFKYDVYLGFGVGDLPVVHRLQEKLEQRDILCYPKYNAACKELSVRTAICEGVPRSRKCLLYVSEAFVQDKSYKFEVAEVLNKANRFSRDMLIILKDSQLADMPSELSGCHVSSVVDVGTFENPKFLYDLATTLKKGRCFLRNICAKLADFRSIV